MTDNVLFFGNLDPRASMPSIEGGGAGGSFTQGKIRDYDSKIVKQKRKFKIDKNNLSP